MRLIGRRHGAEEREIDRDAPAKTGAARFLAILGREWWELMKLNLLLLVFCLPIVTIPAALTGATRITTAMVRDENHYLLDDFWETFRRQFWQATLIGWGVLLAVGVGCFATLSYGREIGSASVFVIPALVSGLGTLLIVLAGSHLLTMMVLTDLPARRMLANAALLALVWVLPGLAAVLLGAAIWILHIVAYPVSVFIPATFGFSLTLLLMTFQSQTALERYVFRARSAAPGTMED